MGYTEPLTLTQLCPLLSEQYQLFLAAYECYKKLILSQIDHIEKSLEEIEF